MRNIIQPRKIYLFFLFVLSYFSKKNGANNSILLEHRTVCIQLQRLSFEAQLGVAMTLGADYHIYHNAVHYTRVKRNNKINIKTNKHLQ